MCEHLSCLFSVNFCRTSQWSWPEQPHMPSVLLLRRQRRFGLWLESSRWKRKEPRWLISSTQPTNWVTAAYGITSMQSSSLFRQALATSGSFPGAQGCRVSGKDGYKPTERGTHLADTAPTLEGVGNKISTAILGNSWHDALNTWVQGRLPYPRGPPSKSRQKRPSRLKEGARFHWRLDK